MIKIGAIVLSRFDSSRLPGKALRLVNGKALIEYVLERANKVQGLCDVVVATSSRTVDDPIAKFCHDNEIKIYRGSGDDVANRFLDCMKENDWDAAIRINGDSPLHSDVLLSQAVEMYTSNDIDLITNVFPRSYPIGMSIELISQLALRSAYAKMIKDSNFEHVTEYFYENSKDFNLELLPKNTFDHSKIKLAVDTISDFQRFEWIVEKLGDDYLNASYQKIIDLYFTYEN